MATEIKTPQFFAYLRTVPAHDESQIDAEGDFFYVKEAEQPLLYQMDTGPILPWDVGTGPDSRGNAIFTRLTVKNPWSVPVRIVVYVGKGGVIDNRFTLVPSRNFALPVTDAPTEILGSPTTSIANGETIDFLGVAPAGYIQRRSISISNEDPNARLRLKDKNGNFFATIEPKSTQIHFVSGKVSLFNNSGGAVTFCVGETWWVPFV